MMSQNFPDSPQEAEAQDERLDRQVRIPGWNQEALTRARVGVCGDDPWLTGLVMASAAALGINRLMVVAPELDPRLISAARGLNPDCQIAFFPGFFSHPLLEDLVRGSAVLVDLSHHAFATKLLLNLAHREGLPLVRGFSWEKDGLAGAQLFTYRQGREWRELLEMLAPEQLPALRQRDPVLALVIAGLVLEEVKKLLLDEPVTPEVVLYTRAGLRTFTLREGARGRGPLPPPSNSLPQPLIGGWEGSLKGRPGEHGSPATPSNNLLDKTPLAVVGAGALGNFVGLGLAAAGFINITFIDPDPVEITNLNRQVLFWDAVGQPKAEALARRLKEWFGITVKAETAYVTRDTDLSEYAAVFDGTDNFESRIILSEKCREGGQVLISGGTGVTAGQVVVYDPAKGGPTPADLLGLYDIVGRRDVEVKERDRASCVYQAEPAVIMTNQIIGGLMVDALRRLMAGEEPPNLFYDALSEVMF